MESSIGAVVNNQRAVNQVSTVRKSLLGSKLGTQSLKKRARIGENMVHVLLTFCGVISIFTTLGIVAILAQESVHFFDSRAYIITKAPVVDETQYVGITEAINESQTTIPVTFEGNTVPFHNDQYVHIGDETMLVKDRGRRTIVVERGVDGTTPAAHSPDELLYGMVEQQIKPLEMMTTDTDTILITDTFGREFEIGDLIRLGLEVMEITAVNPDSLIVRRGALDSNIAEHATDVTIEVADEPGIVEFLTSTSWRPTIGEYGVWPLLNATFLITLISLFVAVPLGLGAAIYLSEFAPENLRGILKPVLEILAGIPTVVYGFFALTFMSPLLRGIFGDQVQFQNVLSAGLVVGVLLVPYISSFSEDALNAVPDALREASYGLGATKLETTVKVVVPAAISGIVSALILAASRAIGETMIVALAAGAIPNFSFDVFAGGETITGHIARISGGDMSYDSIQYASIFILGATLFVITFVLNVLSGYVARRLREQY